MFQRFLLVGGGLMLGGLLGASLSGGSFLNGRLSACKDITGVMNKASPIPLECVIEKGEVYIVTPAFPGGKFTLDGQIKP